MNKCMKKALNYLGRTGAWTAEGAMSELALPAAVLSTTNNGNYLERSLAGVTATLNFIKGGLEAYIGNTGVRDVVNDLGLGVMKSLGNVATNIQEDPEKAFYAALVTWAGCKVIPKGSRGLRKKTIPWIREKIREKQEYKVVLSNRT